MNNNPKFLTLAEAKLIVDTLNRMTSEAATEMNRANEQARQTYADQLTEIGMLIESKTERNKLARYAQRNMVEL
jgi:hypothetical protein